MQRCPAAPKAAPAMAFSVASLSASASTTAWFLAPRLACTRAPRRVARAWMCSPAALEPTKEMARIAGASQMKLTASCAPWMTLSTPGGRPASLASSARRTVVDGSSSLGFMRQVLPVTTASGNIHSGIMAGKLKGVMPATTPSGCT